MAIHIPCPCGIKLRIRAEYSGRRVKCPGCGAVQRCPALDQEKVSHLERANGVAGAAESPVLSSSLPEPDSSPRGSQADAETRDELPPLPTAEKGIDKEAPRQIGPYRIERALGRGAHGIVYRAHRRQEPDMPVALKLVHKRGPVDHLLLEPALLSQLDHPCIVGIEDYFLRGDDLVLALEYIDGRDLKTELDEGRVFSQPEIRELLVQLAAALAQAHGRHIIHRDIKPGNILVARAEEGHRFVLTDFGIGRRAEGIQVEQHGGGTYLFMAPEQARGRPGPQSDLWALGVVAYRLLTGRLPFTGPGLEELSQQISYAAPVPPSQVCSGPVDPELEAIVLRLLDKSLQERFASAEELLAALGYREDPEKVLAVARRPARTKVRTSLDRQLDRAIGLRLCGLVAAMVLYLISGGLLSGLLLIAGMLLFYLGQNRQNLLWTGVALAVIGLHAYVRYLNPAMDAYGLDLAALAGRFQVKVLAWLGPGLSTVIVIAFLFLAAVLFVAILFLPVFAGWMYASVRRLQRQRELRRTAMAAKADSETFLDVFQKALDNRFEDVEFHLKYAETLYSAGQIADAAVEARLLLRQDPYHFSANLLLAHAYLSLGLGDDCLRTCEEYLAVSGYCFEFGALRQQCRHRLAIP